MRFPEPGIAHEYGAGDVAFQCALMQSEVVFLNCTRGGVVVKIKLIRGLKPDEFCILDSSLDS